MRFVDRHQAGERLAKKLTAYAGKPQTIVIGLPRGGVVTAATTARLLNLPLDIVCPRKIGAPFNEEYAIGAVTETGDACFNERVINQLGVSQQYLDHAVQTQSLEARRRLTLYRQGRLPRQYRDWTVILIDDGIATGATMKAAIQSMRAEQAKEIVVATPVIPPEHVREFKEMTDAFYYLAAPEHFSAVGQFYGSFEATTDDEVIALLQERFAS